VKQLWLFVKDYFRWLVVVQLVRLRKDSLSIKLAESSSGELKIDEREAKASLSTLNQLNLK